MFDLILVAVSAAGGFIGGYFVGQRKSVVSAVSTAESIAAPAVKQAAATLATAIEDMAKSAKK